MWKQTIRIISSILALGLASAAQADWHTGKIIQFGHGYDGSTVTFLLSGWTRSNCTCYATWSNQMCLDRSRVSFKEEYAWLLRSRTTGQTVNVNIDEVSCKLIALYESD